MNQTKKYIVLDTETCPITTAPLEGVDPAQMLVYNIGWMVTDRKGRVYRTRSIVVKDIFFGCPVLMRSAYYADKIPQYLEGIVNGEYVNMDFFEARKLLLADMKEFGVYQICAHNARFDVGALNNTTRTLLGSRWVKFFPNYVEIWDSMKMAQQTICKQATYRKWCIQHDEITKNKQVRKTAQALYRYLSGNWEFEEAHTALEDVTIEAQIVSRCFAQHKHMDYVLYEATEQKNF